MLQRVQTLFFLLACGSLVIMFFMPLALVKPYPESQSQVTMFCMETQPGECAAVNNYGFPFAIAASALLFLYTLLQFKNRKRQVILSRFNFLLLAVAMVLLSVYISNAQAFAGGQELSLQSAFFLPVVAVAFNWLAARAIKKDEELVRAADRIR